jgi:hypothetical protein
MRHKQNAAKPPKRSSRGGRAGRRLSAFSTTPSAPLGNGPLRVGRQFRCPKPMSVLRNPRKRVAFGTGLP